MNAVDKGYVCMGGKGIWKTLGSFSQFCSNSKTTVKNEAYKINKHTKLKLISIVLKT